jgi:hypothetical protein
MKFVYDESEINKEQVADLKSYYSKWFTADNATPDRQGMVDHVKSSIGEAFSTNCWSTNNSYQRKDGYIGGISERLIDDAKNSKYKGSDTHQNYINDREQYLDNQQITFDELEQHLIASLEAFKELFEEEWVESKKAVNSEELTGAEVTAVDLAQKILDKRAERKQRRATK